MHDTVTFKNGLPYYTSLTSLPQTDMRSAGTVRELFNAVLSKDVKGAVSISMLSAMIMRSCAELCDSDTAEGRLYEARKTAKALLELPMADILLKNAVNRMLCVIEKAEKTDDTKAIKIAAADECEAMMLESTEICRTIGINTLGLLKNAKCVMTVGEGGALTAVRYGTALSFAYAAKEDGRKINIICCRGERDEGHVFLTHHELCENGIEHTIASDAEMSDVMRDGHVDAILAPLDITAGGIMQAAICAEYFGIPFYICAPHKALLGISASASNAKAVPFDARLITGFITEHGVFDAKA